MIALLLAILMVIVFASRYAFLEPRLPLKLGPRMQKLLGYSTPAVLAAIIGPLVFVRDETLITDISNPYLIGTTVAVALILITRNTLLTTVLSMLVFWLIH